MANFTPAERAYFNRLRNEIDSKSARQAHRPVMLRLLGWLQNGPRRHG